MTTIRESGIDSASHRSSSMAGVQALKYGPTIPSDGVRMHAKPAPSDGSTPSLVQLDAQEALNAAAIAWVHADKDSDPNGSTTLDLIAAALRFEAVMDR